MDWLVGKRNKSSQVIPHKNSTRLSISGNSGGFPWFSDPRSISSHSSCALLASTIFLDTGDNCEESLKGLSEELLLEPIKPSKASKNKKSWSKYFSWSRIIMGVEFHSGDGKEDEGM